MMARMGLDSRDGAIKMLQSMLTKNILLLVYPASRSTSKFEDNSNNLYTFCSISTEDQPPQEVVTEPARASPPRKQHTTHDVVLAIPDPDIELPQLRTTPLAPTEPPQLLQQSQSHPQILEQQPPPPPQSQLVTQLDQPLQPLAQSQPLSQLQSLSQPELHPPQTQLEQTQPQTQPEGTPQLQSEQTQPQTQPEQIQLQPLPDQQSSLAQPDQPQSTQDKSNIKNNKGKGRNSLELTVGDWLNSIHCGHLVPIFDSEDITFDIIPIMDYKDLEVLGIHPNDIKVLLKHIKILKTNITRQAEDKLKQNKKKK